ncbi:MAG: alpha/beta fold hydrolase [Alphaproteobacteria bacterium]|nr:alpha/beta fold hydrolase [Alphaproteobacteria bacterium]
MPYARVGRIQLYYEEAGSGDPVLFVHEFAGDHRSWEPQMGRLSRRYRCIAFNARGYPPSDVPESWQDYSQDAAAEDVAGLLRALDLHKAHVVGCSMGAFATLHFGLRFPDLARSLVVVGAGYGAPLELRERFQREANAVADRIEAEGMAEVAKTYMTSPSRAPFRAKDPRGFANAYRIFSEHSARGSANTLRGYQARRPSLYALEAELKRLRVPTLLVIGDEDDPGLDANLFLKRTIPGAGLAVVPRTGHAVNLEEPDHFHRLVEDFFAQVEHGGWSIRDLEGIAPDDILGMGRR